MDKVIPILPCPNMGAQTEFFQAIGFQLLSENVQPNAYAVVEYGDISLHFWVNKKLVPAENPTMCIVQVADVHSLCQVFTDGLKAHYGKIPRTGAPKITKVRELKEDSRFTLTDTGGNTFYICAPRATGEGVPLRTLLSETHAKDFSVLYDLLHSKESADIAARFLPKLMAIVSELEDLDKAKLLLIAFDIHGQMGLSFDHSVLNVLIEAKRGEFGDWDDVYRKYHELRAMTIDV